VPSPIPEIRPPKPNVIRVIARLNVGGPARHVIFLTRELRERYPTLLVAGSVEAGEADMGALAESAGIEVISVEELGRSIRPVDDLVAFWKLWRIFRRARPTIAHTHTAKAGTLGRLAAFLAGVPIRVHTYHGHVLHGYFGRFKNSIFIAIEAMLARITTQIVTISPSQRVEIAGYLRLATDRLRVIPLGLDLRSVRTPDRDRARAEFRRSIGVRDADFLVGIVGRLVPIKNHSLALQALERLAPQHPELRLVLVGGGEMEAALRGEAASRGIADRVIFAGWRDDLANVYAGCDIIALTSQNEGTPVCLIEALAAGRAVVATDVGGVADVLDGGRLGVLIPAGDSEALAARLADLMRQDRRHAFEDVAVEEIMARYDVGRLAADVADLYDELVGGPSGPARPPRP